MNDHISNEDLAAYVDGLLAADKSGALESHFSRCPECLDELAEISVLRRGRDKIPARFLKLALGEKSKITKPALPLRLVFEVAAAFVVVVFIGYFFLSGNRFWQTPERQTLSFVAEKKVSTAEPAALAHARENAPLPVQSPVRANAGKTKNERDEAAGGRSFGDSAVPQKMANTVAASGMSAAKAGSGPTAEEEIKLQESAVESETFSAVQMDLAAKDKQAAKGKVAALAETKQNLEKQKNLGTTAELASEPQEEKLKDEISQSRASVALPATAGIGRQPVLADKKQNAALARKEMAGKKTMPPVSIEGDVDLSELHNPELIFTWSWFQKGLVLELRIDGAGTVTAVVLLGKIDPLLAGQAENEAKKLLFSVSEKKSRRALLIADR
jgi:hypothetical protein